MSKLCEFSNEISKLEKEIELFKNELIITNDNINERNKYWNRIDGNLNEIFKIHNSDKCILNVSGNKHMVSLLTLKNFPNSLFDQQIFTGEIKSNSETYYERNNEIFKYLLNYLRNKNICLDVLSLDEINLLLDEAKYFQILELIKIIEQFKINIKPSESSSNQIIEYDFEKIEFSELEEFFYHSKKFTFPLKDVEFNKIQLNEIKGFYGIALNSPGSLIVEFKLAVPINCIQCNGFIIPNFNLVNDDDLYNEEKKCNEEVLTNWNQENGKGSLVHISDDKLEWKQIAIIPDNFGKEIIEISFDTVKTKYIKVSNTTSKIGFSNLRFFLKIKE